MTGGRRKNRRKRRNGEKDGERKGKKSRRREEPKYGHNTWKAEQHTNNVGRGEDVER